jgi:hypothetical protein
MGLGSDSLYIFVPRFSKSHFSEPGIKEEKLSKARGKFLTDFMEVVDTFFPLFCSAGYQT